MLLAFAVGSNLAFTTTGATVDTTGSSVDAKGSAADTLKWEDLAPPWDEAESPLTPLNQQQTDDLYTLVYGPNYGDRSGKKDADEQEAYDRLKASGVDPDGILAKIEKLRDEADIHDRTLVPGLDGRVIRLPGYVLPLDFDGSLVRSFLLVPYVGACIHVPPPPPNQIVYVELKQGFKSPEVFAPVWVTGRMSTGMNKTSLTWVDGSTDVNFGYALQATKVEPYEE
ncbi:MAG: DUF3299 domain-containing protein, partial [Hyphomicrobiales bacterium]